MDIGCILCALLRALLSRSQSRGTITPEAGKKGSFFDSNTLKYLNDQHPLQNKIHKNPMPIQKQILCPLPILSIYFLNLFWKNHHYQKMQNMNPPGKKIVEINFRKSQNLFHITWVLLLFTYFFWETTFYAPINI